MNIRAFRRLSAIVALAVATSLPSFAQTVPGSPAFVGKLLVQLRQDGWSPAASQALAQAAEKLNWNGTNGADPEVVALALEFGAKQDSSLPATIQARLALELAVSSVEMEQAGMGQRSVAIAALNAVRYSMPDLQSAVAGHTPGTGVGDIIGKAVSTAVRNQIQASLGPQANGHAAAGQGVVISGGPYGPPSGISAGGDLESDGAPGSRGR